MRRFLSFLSALALLLLLLLPASALAAGVTQGPGGIAPVCQTVPARGATDNAATIQAALTRCAGIGTVLLGAGAHKIAAPILVPSRTRLHAAAGATITSTVAAIPGDATSSPFVLMYGAGAGVSTTLSSPVAVGDTTITVGASILATWVDANGVTRPTSVAWGDGAAQTVQTAEVLSVTGAGPYVLTLSEPAVYAFASGKSVQTIDPVTDVEIDGHGALITGTGSTIFEMPKVRGVKVRRFRISAAAVNIAVSWDLGSRDSVMEDIDVDGLGTSSIGFSMESTLRCSIIRCHGRRLTSRGHWLSYAANSVLADSSATQSQNGAVADNGVNIGTIIRGGQYSANTDAGVYVTATSGLTIDGVTAERNTTGITLGVGASGVTLSRSTLVKNSTAGALLSSALSVQLVGNYTAANGIVGVYVTAAGDVVIVGHESRSDYYGPLGIAAAATVRVSGLLGYGASTGSGFWNGVWVFADGPVVSVRDSLFDLTSATVGHGIHLDNAATLLLAGVRTRGGPASSIGVYSATGVASGITYGPGVDVSSAVTPYAVGVAATQNSAVLAPGHP